ncbi:hypothetical protein [Hydrococcus rivularis]|uniref:hypothetical protein n=1 Tax=Hydrococcus rivularis TaxID=1616834 RepID=UPI000AE50399|nr:hypothetical protein [Hydrococcus rivularis]
MLWNTFGGGDFGANCQADIRSFAFRCDRAGVGYLKNAIAIFSSNPMLLSLTAIRYSSGCDLDRMPSSATREAFLLAMK